MRAEPWLLQLLPSNLTAEEAARLGEALRRVLETGRESWPELGLPEETFARHVLRHLPREKDLVAALEALQVADLYLACACAQGLGGAVRAFQARLGPQVEAAVRGLKRPPGAEEDLRQMLWEKLLVGAPGRPAKIAEYAGRGSLEGWVKVAAVRTALNLREQRQSGSEPVHPTPELPEQPSPDPEVDFLKRHYRVELREALEGALESLPEERRNVLRLYFVEGLSIDKIGAVYGIHRATAARWVAAARQGVLEETCRRLSERLRVSDSELESILRMVRSQVEFSLARL